MGHLFQGRFKSILVEKEHHLLALCRYLALDIARVSRLAAVRRGADGSGYDVPRPRTAGVEDAYREVKKLDLTLLLPLRDGYYSVAAAERDYGMIITESMQLDEAATAVCRRGRKEAMSQRKTADEI